MDLTSILNASLNSTTNAERVTNQRETSSPESNDNNHDIQPSTASQSEPNPLIRMGTVSKKVRSIIQAAFAEEQNLNEQSISMLESSTGLDREQLEQLYRNLRRRHGMTSNETRAATPTQTSQNSTPTGPRRIPRVTLEHVRAQFLGEDSKVCEECLDGCRFAPQSASTATQVSDHSPALSSSPMPNPVESSISMVPSLWSNWMHRTVSGVERERQRIQGIASFKSRLNHLSHILKLPDTCQRIGCDAIFAGLKDLAAAWETVSATCEDLMPVLHEMEAPLRVAFDQLIEILLTRGRSMAPLVVFGSLSVVRCCNPLLLHILLDAVVSHLEEHVAKVHSDSRSLNLDQICQRRVAVFYLSEALYDLTKGTFAFWSGFLGGSSAEERVPIWMSRFFKLTRSSSRNNCEVLVNRILQQSAHMILQLWVTRGLCQTDLWKVMLSETMEVVKNSRVVSFSWARSSLCQTYDERATS